MSLSRREMVLVGATTAVVIGLVSYVIGKPQIDRISAAHKAIAKIQSERTVLEKLIAQRGTMEKEIETLRAQLPRFTPEEQVSAKILLAVRKIADEHQLTVSRVEAAPETLIGDLSEVAIECAWEGTLDSIARFLHAVQGQGAMLDIRQLNIQPAQNTTQAGRLRGNFKMFYAFKREKPGATPAAAPSTNAVPAAATNAAPVIDVGGNPAPPATNAAAGVEAKGPGGEAKGEAPAAPPAPAPAAPQPAATPGATGPE